MESLVLSLGKYLKKEQAVMSQKQNTYMLHRDDDL